MLDTPHWLIQSWTRTCLEAKATAEVDEIERVGHRLLGRWQEPTRHYHTVRHLAEVLCRVDELAEETQAPALVRLAVWYHGAVFNPLQLTVGCRPGEDVVASSDVAGLELGELGLPVASVTRIRSLVCALERHAPVPGDHDGAALCDADFAILAAAPQKYARYLKANREEFSHLPLVDYLRARESITSRLLARKHIFTSPQGRIWEDPARQNLQVELHQVRKELDRISASAPIIASAPNADMWATSGMAALTDAGPPALAGSEPPRPQSVGTLAR